MSGSWSRMWEVFHGALEVEEGARERFIEEATKGDGELRSRVEKLLKASGSAAGFMEPGERPLATEAMPERLGRYLIREKIGEGGFADVYLAMQTEPVRREVAVKVLRRGGGGSLARFEAEQQTLAVLRHPNIATVLDAGVGGVDEGGRAYVVMEHIPGRPITGYCDEKRLGIGGRLSLFAQTCAAVQHAHHKGIIHRDLKPANVLVMEVDGMPQVKVIDFGIATVGGPSVGGGGLAGTPGYMSPEQAGAGDVDTRTDVFSLGVVLYELLAGVPPFESVGAATEWDCVARAEDPPTPSSRVTQLGAGAADAAQRRGVGAGVLARRLRGDLDWIVMRALERDRTRRYGSPAELADDLGRYLAQRPVAAGPAGTGYRGRKFVQRHRAGVGAALLVMALVVAGAVQLAVTAKTESRLRGEAEKATGRAKRSAKIVEGVNEFVTQDILQAADPRKAPNPGVTMLEVVQAAEAKIGDRFKDEPEIEAAVRRTVGDTYRSLGKFDKALPNLERSVLLFVSTVGEEDDRTQGAMNDLAILYRTLGRFSEAEPLYLKGIAYRKSKFGPEDRETLSSMVNLGVLYAGVGRLSDAQAMLSGCLATMERVLGPEDPDTVVTMQHLGVVYQKQARWDVAEPIARATYERQKKLHGEDHPYTIAALGNLAINIENMGRLAEAEVLKRAVLEAAIRRQGEGHIDTAVARASLGLLYIKMERFEEAEALLTQAVERHRQVFGPEHPGTLQMINNLGMVYDRWGRYGAAEALYALAADGARKTMAETNWSRGLYLLNHGRCLALRMDRAAEGEPRLLEAMTILEATLGAEHARTREAAAALADLCEKVGRGEEAARYRARAGGGQR